MGGDRGNDQGGHPQAQHWGMLGTPLGVSPPAGGDKSPAGALSSREDVRPRPRKGPCAFTAPTQAAPALQLQPCSGVTKEVLVQEDE